MIIGIDPTVDYAFKHVFGRESTKPILIDVLNGILNPPSKHRVEDLELLNPFNPKEAMDDKLSILDIKTRDQSGRQFNVEMQMLAYRFFEKRIAYYLSKLHHQQLHQGEDYLQLKPTNSINFLGYVMFPNTPRYHLTFGLLERMEHFSLTEDMEFHMLELVKFKKTPAELKSSLDIWLYFLRHAANINTEAVPAVMQQPLVLRALEELRMLSQTDLERERYEARRKAQLDYSSGLSAARLEGKEEGLEKGEKIGIIHAFERLLNKPETRREQLLLLSEEELTQLSNSLQSQLAKK
jgi:predicted transposase/invertase (TIGR01784 family)